MKRVTLSNYRKDKYYPRVVCAVATILQRSDVFSPVDILLEMGNLSKKNLDSWRCGQVPYLERVIEGNLSRLARILRLIGFHAHDLNMVPRMTVYCRHGKGKKQKLRFSKSGIKGIEDAYSRHFLWNQSQDKKLSIIRDFIPGE